MTKAINPQRSQRLRRPRRCGVGVADSFPKEISLSTRHSRKIQCAHVRPRNSQSQCEQAVVSEQIICMGLVSAEPGVEICGAWKKSEGAEFAEACGALAVAVFTRSDDGHERHACITRGESVINVVAEI